MCVIKLFPIDMIDYNLEEGEMIDVESALLLHAQNKQQSKKKK